MSADAVRFPRWEMARSPWLLVTLHVPFAAIGALFVITRQELTAGPVALVVLVAIAIGGLQLRHSLAAARGERPAGGPWTFLALVALVYVPMWWLGWDWMPMQWFVIASGAMVLRGPLAVVVGAAPVIGTLVAVWTFPNYGWPGGYGFGGMLTDSVYYLAVLMMGGASLYGSAWLVRVLNDLDAARTELAELAVARERLRVSRDLHDLLGQSLSAVSLKGEVALRLLPTDTAAARAEIASLTGVAREALHGVRAVTRDEHGVSLAAEIDAASALLGAAGILTEVDLDLPDLAPATEEVFAWAVREGATNTLRHSQATTWTVTGARRDGRVMLEIVNDGAPVPTGHGRGLAGIHERALDLAGSATTERTADGRFRLHVELPEDDS